MQMKMLMLRHILFLATVILPFLAFAEPVAMVTDMKGSAWHGGDKALPINMLHYFEAPTLVRLGPNSTLTVTYFANSVQYSFKGPALLTIEAASPRVSEGTPAETRRVGPEKAIGGGLTKDQWRRLQQAAIVMRSTRAAFLAIAPNQTMVLSTRVEFSWTPAEGATAYRVTFSDDNDATLVEMETTATAVALPVSVRLVRGRTYRWKVEAVGVPDPLIAFASFATASVEMEQRMAQLRPIESADLAAQVYYATLLDIEGFTFDARAEWRRLARMFPDERAIQRRAQ